MQIPYTEYVFRWRWVTVLVTMVLVILFIQLGLWQWHKAQARQAMQDALTGHANQPVIVTGRAFMQGNAAKQWHGKLVRLHGRYLPEKGFLLDNQVENGQAGFHVMTPFLLDDGQVVVWVNRGWVAGFKDHQQTPMIATTTAPQTIQGLAWQIKKTAFQLGAIEQGWQPVQQVIDFAKLRNQVPYQMPNLVLKLDANVTQDGFVRHWQLPSGEIEKNLSYAYQWFGFAIAAVCIAAYQMLEKRSVNNTSDQSHD